MDACRASGFARNVLLAARKGNHKLVNSQLCYFQCLFHMGEFIRYLWRYINFSLCNVVKCPKS